MEAKELMIGDWVQNPYGYKAQVKNIRWIPKDKCDDEGGYYLIDIARGESFLARLEEKDIEPIPLTSELLEANGFERVLQSGCANPYHWMLEKYEEPAAVLLFRIKAFNTPFRGIFVSIDNPSACETISFYKQIEFVHELQHALQLCEIELELKLED